MTHKNGMGMGMGHGMGFATIKVTRISSLRHSQPLELSTKRTMRILSICVVFAAFVALSAAEHGTGSKSRRESALDKIVPRLLWNLRHGDSNQESHRQQPQIIFVQQPSSNSNDDRHQNHQHSPHYPYYPFYPPPQQTRPPQPQYPGMEYLGTGSGGPTFLIVNPNNMQGIYLPANSSNTTNGRRSAHVPSFADLLQGLNLNDLADGSLFDDDSEVVDAAEEGSPDVPAVENDRPAVSAAAQEDDHEGDLLSEDEIDALDRQNNRGLNPKLLFSMLMQNKRRRRIQEVLAGIYFRNTHLNRK
ncbi:uncharacterized protein LOC108162137 [Drosophila miranda]|uniref:uncharacterized protein LOC108162137 n=1 Tax=Drosophila miranda TaxID=7229 RepID=UPI0007E7E339|nr:uncharacterized protein LOC108162137 [Drosophila miranda]